MGRKRIKLGLIFASQGRGSRSALPVPGKTFIVRSEQARYGYIIGTRGPASGLTTGSASR